MSAASAQQRSAEWFAARVGYLTGSRASAAIDRTKAGKKTAAYEQMVDELVTERITGMAVEHFTTPAMQWGIDHEDEARAEYECATGAFVEQVGFITHPAVAWLGASPDGLVGEDGLVEIKCPSSLTHIKRLRAGAVPDEYRAQMCIQLLCTGRKWCDFVDYDPRLPDEYADKRLMIVRYEPTAEELADALEKSKEFLTDVQKVMDDLRSM